MVYNLAAIGGTFDRLHVGHIVFLRFAFSHAKEVIIGLTSDKYIEKAEKEYKEIESYEVRNINLIKFLKENNFFKRAKIIPIDNIFGPLLDSKFLIDGLIVTKDTEKGAIIINKYRQQKGLLALPIIISPCIKSIQRDIICSTSIRQGKMDRDGNIYLPQKSLMQTFTLPDFLRDELKLPLGKILKGDKKDFVGLNPETTITVGDITTRLGNSNKLNQKISVIDFTVARKKEFVSLQELGFKGDEKIFSIANPPSQITSQLLRIIADLFAKNFSKKRIVIFIEGEEDLAVIPLILASPLGFVILYGQPNQGFVKVIVTEDIKLKAYALFKKFKV